MISAIRAVELPEGQRIARKGGKSQSTAQPYRPVEYPNTLRSRTTARIMEVLSEGQIQGMATYHSGDPGDNFWRGVILDGTPVFTGSYNFNLYNAAFRSGLPQQDPVPGFPMAEAEVAVGVECKPYDAVIRQLSSPNISRVRVMLRFAAMYMTELDGDVNGTDVSYEIDYQLDGGGWIYGTAETLYGKTMSPYERTFEIYLGWYGQATSTIEVRVTRLTSDPDQGEANKFFWSSYTEVQDGTLSYDDTALMAVTVDAEEFPNIPTRGYLLDGMLLQIPNNYDPWNRTYANGGLWDGTFYSAWTNNPAWVLYNLLINERWGLGRYLDVNAIDKWSFYTAAIYNDGWVPDSKGSWQPRWTCNAVVNTRQDAWQLLTAVASNMLATLYFANGTVFLVQDAGYLAPTRLFGPADVTNGAFDYTGTDYRSRYNAAAITWNDPDDDYKPAVELVQDGALVAEQGYRETQVTAFGITNRGQAVRLGRWLIYTSQYETEAVSFSVGLENADIRPGEVININDPGRAGARLAGRLLHDDGTDTVTLDRTPGTMSSPGGWTLYFQIASAADAQKPTIYATSVIELLAGNQLRVTSKPAGAEAGTMWLLSASAVNPTTWRVAAVTDAGGGIYTILATEWDLYKAAYVDYGVYVAPPSTSLLPKGPLAPPSDINFAEYIYLDAAGKPNFAVIISWTASKDPRVVRYSLEMSGPGGDHRLFQNIAGISQEVPDMRQGEWTVRLRAFDGLGRYSIVVNYSFVPVGLTAKPLVPTGFFITPQGGNLITLIWLPTGEIDVMFYWIKFTPRLTDASWDRATTSIARVDRNTTQVSTPMRAGTYMLKTVDSLGQESDSWIEAVLEPQQTETSIFFDWHEEPDWAGTLGPKWHINVDELWLPPPVAPEPIPPGIFPGDRGLLLNSTPTKLGTYIFGNSFDLGASTTVIMTAYIDGYGTLFLGDPMALWSPLSSQSPLAAGTHGTISAWVPLAMAVPLATGTSKNWDAHLDARVSVDGTTWQPWFPLKSTIITGQKFEWRLHGVLYDLETTLRITEAHVVVEVPLRNVQGADAALDGTGHLVVTYAAPFLVTPTVQITARQSLAPGGNIVITESDRDHFKVEHRNASGVATAGGSIDYFVQGYGGHA
jgi:predicted phage tail protein